MNYLNSNKICSVTHTTWLYQAKILKGIKSHNNGRCTRPETNVTKTDLPIVLQVVQMEWVKLRVRLGKEMGVKVASLEE
jgi:hypothetical protein